MSGSAPRLTKHLKSEYYSRKHEAHAFFLGPNSRALVRLREVLVLVSESDIVKAIVMEDLKATFIRCIATHMANSSVSRYGQVTWRLAHFPK